ncbi:hypothetical protein SAMN05216370_0073 [Pseudomonas peli]|uniref:Uncharacterized protein n=1 Tax=Pseudomonas peli TaxID=592361 RepID=A0AB37ZDG5_9PSED|nr:hypothetical protein [Pseudomonas peli]NMZ71430.1 hypothetical protein [Pseudomonas peli]SCW89725.1 hypothetical protein SAMN05216370_0073 [Pseudomonas peli]
MPDDKELKQSLDSLNNSLGEISKSLSVLSAMKIAEEFYTKEERAEFYKEYEQRLEQAEKARAALHEKARGGPSEGGTTQEMMDIASKANDFVMDCRKKNPALVTLYRHSK